MPAMASTQPFQWGGRCLQISLRPSHCHPIASLTPIPARRPPPQHSQTRSIRSILKPPPQRNRFDTSLNLAPTALQTASALKRKEHHTPHRTGLLAIKKGMSSTFSADSGARIPLTILQLDRCEVVGHKTRDTHGYWAVQVGHGWRDWRNVSRAELGVLAARDVAPKARIVEFRVRGPEALLPVGTRLPPSWFVPGQLVDVRGTSKGKGFAGGMKKHGWSGQPASHGQSLTHRTMGSAGGSQGSGSRVIPGKKMPGRMGGINHTVQNLEVVQVDDINGLVVVKGAVSGPKKSIVQIWDAKKRPEQREKLGLPMVPPDVMAAAAAAGAGPGAETVAVA